MQFNETAAEGLTKTYAVTIKADDIAKQMDTELKSLGKQVKIPGFRPGFVPMKVLKQRYGKSIVPDVLKNVVADATRKVIEDSKLRPASQPDVKLDEFQDEKDLTFSLTIEGLPDVPELDYSDIQVMRETFEVEDAEVDEALERFAKASPVVKPKAKTAKAAKGDVVNMHFEGKVDGELFEGGKAENFSVELGSGRLIGTFEQQLEGMKAGDKKDIEVTFPENYFSQNLAGKPAVFAVEVVDVSAQEMPEIDDEFAKSKGFADARALREAVRSELIRGHEATVRTRTKKRLFDALNDKCDYDLPPKMVEAEFNSIWSRLQQAKEQGEANGDDVYEGRSEEEIREEYQSIAKRRVRLGILLAEIGSREKLEVTRDELTRAIMDQASQFPGQEQAVFEFYKKNPSRLDELRGPILEEKSVDWILGKVKLEDKKVATSELTMDDEDDSDEAKPKAKKTAKKPAAKKTSTDKKDTGNE